MNVTLQTIQEPRVSDWPFVRAGLTARNLWESLLRRLKIKTRTELDRDFADILTSGIEDGAYDVSISIKDRGWRIALGLALPKEVSLGIKAHRDVVQGNDLMELADIIRLARNPEAGRQLAVSSDPREARIGQATLRLGSLMLIASRSGAYTLFATIEHARVSAHELIRAEENASRYDFGGNE